MVATGDAHSEVTYTLNTALGASENAANEAKVLCTAPTCFAHLFETLS
jgi:hypothetical protein